MRGLSLVFSRWHCGTSFWPLSPWIPLYLSQALPTPLPLPELSPDPCCCCVSRVAGFMLLPALLLSLASQLGTLISQQLDPASTAFGLPGPQALQQWGGDRELGLGGVSLCVPLPRKVWIGRCTCRQGLDSQMLGRDGAAASAPSPAWLPAAKGHAASRIRIWVHWHSCCYWFSEGEAHLPRSKGQDCRLSLCCVPVHLSLDTQVSGTLWHLGMLARGNLVELWMFYWL